MEEIKFNIATKNGLIECSGELVDRNGFLYALHIFDDEYNITEISTGMCVCGISKYTKTVNGIDVKSYLLSIIDENAITNAVLSRAKILLKNNGFKYPLNKSLILSHNYIIK